MDFTTTPSAPPQTWRIPGWAWIAISLAVTAEAAINALRAYGLGQHLEHFTVDVPVYGIPTPVTVSLAGAVLVLAAIAISLAQARAAYVAFRPGALARQRVLAAPVALLLLAVSVTALSLTLLEAQRGKTGDEGGQRTAYDTAKGAYDKADEELRRLEGTRTTAEVRAAMDAAPVSRLVFRRTAECTDMTREDSFEACKPILDLRQEMARAIRKLELEQTLPGLKATLTATPRPAEATWIEDWAASIWSWIMGLAVVAVATFGAPLFAEPATRKVSLQVARQPLPAETAQTSFHADDPAATRATILGNPRTVIRFPKRPKNDGKPGNPGNPPRQPKPDNPGNRPYGGQPFSKLEAERDLVTLLATGATVDEQNDLAVRWSVHKGTASKWLRDMRERGLIPASQRIGRRHVLRSQRKQLAAAE